jgi:predicted nucleic acid-binding protein
MIFIDTSVFYARLDKGDRNHDAADAFFKSAMEDDLDLVTTREVVFETHAMLQKASRVLPTADMKPESQKFLESIDRGLATVLPVTEDDHRAARAVVDRYRDKTFSLCDAMSFVVMERFRITTAASFDVHFRQYGKFIRVAVDRGPRFAHRDAYRRRPTREGGF